jgi:hypothetical protein
LALAVPAQSLFGSQSAGKGGCDSSGKIIKAADKRTGREVWQITSGQAPSNSCYFEAQAFTAGDRHLVYASKRSGVYQLYRLDLASEETCPVTHGYGISSLSFSIAPDGKTVYYTEGGRVYRTDVMTGARAVLEFEAGFAVSRYKRPIKFSFGRTFTPDGECSAVGWTDAAGKVGVALVNLAKGIVTKYIDVPGGTGGHTLVCPADPYLVTFVYAPDQQNNMKLPMEQRARSMIIDFRTGQIRPFLIMPLWLAGHSRILVTERRPLLFSQEARARLGARRHLLHEARWQRPAHSLHFRNAAARSLGDLAGRALHRLRRAEGP